MSGNDCWNSVCFSYLLRYCCTSVQKDHRSLWTVHVHAKSHRVINIMNQNVGQCPTWWSLCRIQVAPSVQRHKVWLTPSTRVPCSNAAKTRKPLKFAGVPQTRQQISAVSRPKFTILCGHVEEVLLFKKFFFRLSIHASAVTTQPDKVQRWCQNGDVLRPVFAASRV